MMIKLMNITVAVFAALTVAAPHAARALDDAGATNLLETASRSIAIAEDEAAPTWSKTLAFEQAGSQIIDFRAIFEVENPARFTSLVLQSPSHVRGLTLNGKPIPKPLEGMTYKAIPGIPISLLKQGPNTLQARWTQRVKTQKEKGASEASFVPAQFDSADVDIRLFGLLPSACAFQTGPILGYAGESFFTVSCRVNMPVEVVLEVNNQKYVSEPALLHSFKVEGLTADTQYHYSMKARLASGGDVLASAGPYSIRTLPAGGKFTFAILGDSRTYLTEWAKVAAAVVSAKPAFSVFVGDMVTAGRQDVQWDQQFVGPARDFFATIPFYGVIGNHEQNSPLYFELFPTPGGRNWSQQVGSVLIIGIDGNMDWSSGSELTQWLEGILAKSEAKFIFLSTHYPAWTSGGHGSLGKDGRPRERSIRLGQDVLMPLLKKYDATAMFAGHDHFYERSEPEDGVSVIVTGGAGAPLRNKKADAETQNPHSKVFAKKLHYCALTVDGDICTMKAVTPEGVVIDTRSWAARKATTGMAPSE